MVAWKLLECLRHATDTRISVFTTRNCLNGARMIFEFLILILTPLCDFDEEKGFLFSECFAENFHFYTKLNYFHVE